MNFSHSESLSPQPTLPLDKGASQLQCDFAWHEQCAVMFCKTILINLLCGGVGTGAVLCAHLKWASLLKMTSRHV